jgi:pimeloyl-ACP methyl ester carboxylesterase
VPLLVGDIAAVVKAEKQADAIIVGHDWGGAVAGNVAMS